jgi:hypothetical protein
VISWFSKFVLKICCFQIGQLVPPYALELIALTAGGAARGSTAAAASDAATAPLRRLERHAIAAATRVQYPHAEVGGCTYTLNAADP